MKKRKFALFFCLMMLFSMVSPAMTFAASPESPIDDPVEPEPYVCIDSIDFSFQVSTNGSTVAYCSTYVPNTSYTCEVTLELLKMGSNGSWNVAATKTWTNTGHGTVYIYNDTYTLPSYGSWRLAGTVEVFSGNTLMDSATEYSRVAVYSSTGVVYYA